MSSTAKVKRRRADEVPAFLSPDWLPADSGWPVLDALAADHRRLLDQRAESEAVGARLRKQYETEDKERQAALTAGFREGADAKATKITSPERRTAALADAEAGAKAAREALDGFLGDAVARIEEQGPALLGELDERIVSAGERRAEAQRMFAEAQAEEVEVRKVREWVERNAGLAERPALRNVEVMRFVGWRHLMETFTPRPERDPGDGPELMNTSDPERLTEIANRGVRGSYPGGQITTEETAA